MQPDPSIAGRVAQRPIVRPAQRLVLELSGSFFRNICEDVARTRILSNSKLSRHECFEAKPPAFPLLTPLQKSNGRKRHAITQQQAFLEIASLAIIRDRQRKLHVSDSPLRGKTADKRQRPFSGDA